MENQPVTELTEQDRWTALANLIFRDVPNLSENAAEDSHPKEPASPVVVRRVFGSCPRCRGDVRADALGEPWCVTCGWAGETVSGRYLPPLSEGAPPNYEGSIEALEGQAQRAEAYKSRKKDHAKEE